MTPTKLVRCVLAFLLLACSCPARGHGAEKSSAQRSDLAPKREAEEVALKQTNDFRWLVGKWRCVTRQYFAKEEYLIAATTGDNVLEYFNVHFPFTDEHFSAGARGEMIAA